MRAFREENNRDWNDVCVFIENVDRQHAIHIEIGMERTLTNRRVCRGKLMGRITDKRNWQDWKAVGFRSIDLVLLLILFTALGAPRQIHTKPQDRSRRAGNGVFFPGSTRLCAALLLARGSVYA
jgi:hypothetical protein